MRLERDRAAGWWGFSSPQTAVPVQSCFKFETNRFTTGSISGSFMAALQGAAPRLRWRLAENGFVVLIEMTYIRQSNQDGDVFDWLLRGFKEVSRLA